MDAPTPIRTPLNAHAAKAKPDARPMRLALGAGGLAALSALATAIVLPPRTVTVVQQVPADPQQQTTQQQTDTPPAVDPSAQATRPVRYIQLAPGETAPPGATVIPAPTLVVSVPAPGGQKTTQKTTAQQPVQAQPPAQVTPAPKPPAPAPTPIVIKTTQSGKVVP
jgi:hypothetical protein